MIRNRTIISCYVGKATAKIVEKQICPVGQNRRQIAVEQELFQKSGRQFLVPLKGNIVKARGHAVPARFGSILGANHVCYGPHPHAASSERAFHESHFQFDGCARFDVLWR